MRCETVALAAASLPLTKERLHILTVNAAVLVGICGVKPSLPIQEEGLDVLTIDSPALIKVSVATGD